MEKPNYFLGIEVHIRKTEKHIASFTEKKYALDLLQDWSLWCKPVSTPMVADVNF